MNISIKNINNCEKLDSDKIVDIAEKLNIKIQNDLDYSANSDNYSKSKICKIIKNKVNQINPCAISLYSDTDLSIKKHQLNVANHLVNNRGIIVVHSVGTGKTLSAISTGQCLLIKKLIKHVVVITPTSLQQNFISQAKMYGLSNEDLDTHYTFYTIQGIANAIESNNISSPSNSLVIIDEAHNLRTINGSRFDLINKYIKKASKIMF